MPEITTTRPTDRPTDGQTDREVTLTTRAERIYAYIKRGNIHGRYTHATGFPKKDARVSKICNTPDILRDVSKGKIMDKIKVKHLSNRAYFMGNPVSLRNKLLSS